MLVVDASVAVAICLSPQAFLWPDDELVGPPLLWSETRSAMHELVWRGEADPIDGEEGLRALEDAPIKARRHPRLGPAAWQIADAFGWAKTYDAEYVALAELLGCRLVTLDRRLRRATDRLGFVLFPTEL